ncbi:MAG: DUF1592 domain-containing protein [Verrucomicrobiae bacterium]|nr:DUF1592 domain-containing protein [Verrucomicrobiae bacterium]
MPTVLGKAIERRCLECHDDPSAKGGLDLTALPFELREMENRSRWILIHDRIESGEMPPKSEDLPEAERLAVVAELSNAIADADRGEIQRDGRGPLRRLNRDEFELNLREVLKLPHLDIRDRLPEDRVKDGYNKSATGLDMSRVQLAAYLDAADAALREAMATGIKPPEVTRYRAPATRMFQEAQTFGNREAMFYAKDSKMIPLDAKQLREIRKNDAHDPEVEMALFRSASWPYYGYPDGFVARLPGDYRVRFSARAVVQLFGYELKPAGHAVPMTFRARAPSGPDVSGDVRATGGVMDISPEATEYETVIRLRKGETFEYSLLGLPVPLARNVDGGPPTYRYPPFPEGGQPGVAFRWIEVEGPISPESWPPESHRVLFGDLPIREPRKSSDLPVEVVPEDAEKDALELMRRFAKRAARRPLTDADVEPYGRLVLSRLGAGASFTEALLAGYTAFLASSHLIYLTEPGGEDDSFAIASRLSHFLVNSRPDATLLEQAVEGNLRKSEILNREAERLIFSDGFDQSIRNFTDYWLNLRFVKRDEPDIRLYPEYRFDDYLVESMERETRAFVTALFRENLPVRTLVDSKFAFVNDRLAQHYGLPAASGSGLRRVELPERSALGGLLTQAAILKVTANGTTTSPVVRGAWIMDRIIGEPPPPPPKSVPAVEPDIRGAETIRELLAQHAKEPSCAGCHARFDPVGLALENFDIMGGWRDRYRGIEQGERVTGIDRAGHDFEYTLAESVEPSGQLRDGRTFGDIRDLKTILAADPRKLGRNLLHQLVNYGTGTPVRFSERAEIEAILDDCEPNGFRARDLLLRLIRSRVFLGGDGCE